MYEGGFNCDEIVDYKYLCHACLSSNRTLSSVGDYIDIYIKICDNSLMNLTSQVNVCWECLTLLKKVHAFRRKVEKAQKILEFKTPLEDSLSNLTLSSVETTTFDFPVLDEEADFENYLDDNAKTIEPYDYDKDYRVEDLNKDARIQEDSELMFKIENVRGRCDILDGKSVFDVSANDVDVSVKIEHLSSPENEKERQHRRWQRSAMLVHKRICSYRHSQHFMRPVSDDLAPLYSCIVRRPTDLSTIKRRIKDGVIRTTAEYTRALLLMFANALMYNSSHHFIYQMTLELREETLRELSLLSQAEAEAGAHCPLARLLRRHAPPPAAAAPPPAPPSAPGDTPLRLRPSGLDDETRTPTAHRNRRASVFVPTEPPKAAAPRGRRASVIVTAEPPKAAALRNRRATIFVPVEPPKAAAPRGRRASVFVPAEPQKAAALRGRRASVYVPAETPKAAAPRGRRASVIVPTEPPKAAAPRGRRASVYVPAEPPKAAAPRGRRASVFVPTEPLKAAAPRGRRTSVYVPAEPPKAASLRNRRATIFVPAEPPKAAAPRGRRASVFVPTEPPKAAAPAEPRKRTKHEWPSLDDEYLIAKKYKNSVGILL